MRALLLLACLAGLGLAGCVSAEELRREDAAQCTSYGFTPGTPDFSACLQRESLARRGGAPGVTLGFGVFGGF